MFAEFFNSLDLPFFIVNLGSERLGKLVKHGVKTDADGGVLVGYGVKKTIGKILIHHASFLSGWYLYNRAMVLCTLNPHAGDENGKDNTWNGVCSGRQYRHRPDN